MTDSDAHKKYVAQLEKRNRRFKNTLERCISMAGNPDAAQGCRNIIMHINEVLEDDSMEFESFPIKERP